MEGGDQLLTVPNSSCAHWGRLCYCQNTHFAPLTRPLPAQPLWQDERPSWEGQFWPSGLFGPANVSASGTCHFYAGALRATEGSSTSVFPLPAVAQTAVAPRTPHRQTKGPGAAPCVHLSQEAPCVIARGPWTCGLHCSAKANTPPAGLQWRSGVIL